MRKHRLKMGLDPLWLPAILLATAVGHLSAIELVSPTAVAPYPSPWLTGTLLEPIPIALSRGDIAVQPYLYWTWTRGTYSDHGDVQRKPLVTSVTMQARIAFGLGKGFDIQFLPTASFNGSEGHSVFRWEDLEAQFDYQLRYPTAPGWFPGVELSLGEILPIGRYDHLSPVKNGADASGLGAFATFGEVVFHRIYALNARHDLSTALTLTLAVPGSVHVEGLNAYGGGFDTDGVVSPGIAFNGLLSLELTLTRNWVLAFDTQYTWTGQSSFKGCPGWTDTGCVAQVGLPVAQQLSLAPCLEYNFNDKIGLIAGVWFSVWGRNSPVFTTGAIALSCEF
ncbi:MAG: hypothetical protein ACOYKZ_01470 [Chlamydiia bacterium]